MNESVTTEILKFIKNEFAIGHIDCRIATQPFIGKKEISLELTMQINGEPMRLHNICVISDAEVSMYMSMYKAIDITRKNLSYFFVDSILQFQNLIERTSGRKGGYSSPSVVQSVVCRIFEMDSLLSRVASITKHPDLVNSPAAHKENSLEQIPADESRRRTGEEKERQAEAHDAADPRHDQEGKDRGQGQGDGNPRPIP